MSGLPYPFPKGPWRRAYFRSKNTQKSIANFQNSIDELTELLEGEGTFSKSAQKQLDEMKERQRALINHLFAWVKSGAR